METFAHNDEQVIKWTSNDKANTFWNSYEHGQRRKLKHRREKIRTEYARIAGLKKQSNNATIKNKLII
jgi:hypothetical protein